MKKTFIPPPAVAAEAREGLALRKQFGRGATPVGWARGRQLAARRPVSEDVIKRMYSYFARHFVDKQGKNFDNPLKPSNGKIAWLLWGGDSGARWVHDIRKSLGK
jgi:hypothetical protein